MKKKQRMKHRKIDNAYNGRAKIEADKEDCPIFSPRSVVPTFPDSNTHECTRMHKKRVLCLCTLSEVFGDTWGFPQEDPPRCPRCPFLFVPSIFHEASLITTGRGTGLSFGTFVLRSQECHYSYLFIIEKISDCNIELKINHFSVFDERSNYAFTTFRIDWTLVVRIVSIASFEILPTNRFPENEEKGWSQNISEEQGKYAPYSRPKFRKVICFLFNEEKKKKNSFA